MSLLIFANVVSGMPSGGRAVWSEGVRPSSLSSCSSRSRSWYSLSSWTTASGASRSPSREESSVDASWVVTPPTSLKGQPVRVIPIIFASSVLYIPVLMSNIVPWTSFQNFVNSSLHPTSFFYIFSDFVLILAFTFFYVYIAFEPHQQAEMLRQQGGFVRASVRDCRPRSTSPRC